MRKIFVTGNGTDVGKTFVSAILVESLRADYWKPVQSGSVEQTDGNVVKHLISNDKTVIHPEIYNLKAVASPHTAAELENIHMQEKKIVTPPTSNTLIIEGAGGVYVPLNNKFFIIDLIEQLQAEALVVSRNYLGSINHTLLTIEALKTRKIPIAGIIFNGKQNPSGEAVILETSGIRFLGRVEEESIIDKAVVLKYASRIIVP